MPCPTCGGDDVVPLLLRSLDRLQGVVDLCRECGEVYLVASKTEIPREAVQLQGDGWRAIRPIIDQTVESIAEHPVCRGLFAQAGSDADEWRRDVAELLAQFVALVAPIVRSMDPDEKPGRVGGGE